MDDARKAVQLFISESIEEATAYAKLLHADNDERKEADSSITEEALQHIQTIPDFENRRSTVVFHPQWHKGVVGIVASRLIEHHYKPTIVLTQSGDVLAGSARSVSGFDLYEAVHACREHLITYGGHFAAAGLSLKPENLTAFSASFELAVRKSITEAQLVPEVVIDAELPFEAAQLSFLNIIEQMEPFGPDNLRPVFMTRNTQDTGYSKVVKEHHLQVFLQHRNTSLKGIFFKAAPSLPVIQSGPVDIVYTLDQNEYRGEISVQIKMIDLRPSL
jgi:single-stranded-DNA-specific exonuclease